MHSGIRYTILFVAVLLLQALVFNQVQISVWFNPLIYMAFVILLPMRTLPIVVLACGLLMGVTMDLLMGLVGVNTIASLLTAYCRPLMLKLVVGKENFVDGGVPASMTIGFGKFTAYVTMFVVLHSAVFFSLEAMIVSYAYLIALKVLLNSVVSILLILLVASVFVPKNHN